MPAHDLSVSPDHDLLYACNELEHLVFVPRAIALDAFAARERLPTCRTWGEARSAISARLFQKLVEGLVAERDQPLSDDAAIDHNAETAGGEWPLLEYGQMETWLPSAFFEEFATYHDGFLTSGYLLEVWAGHHNRQDEMIEWLRQRGYKCEDDPRLADIFNYGG